MYMESRRIKKPTLCTCEKTDADQNFTADQRLLASQKSRDVRRPVFGVSAQVCHKPASTPTEESYNIEVLDISRE